MGSVNVQQDITKVGKVNNMAVNGEGNIDFKAIKKSRTNMDCVYEYKDKYKITGIVSIDSFQTKEYPEGRLTMDLNSPTLPSPTSSNTPGIFLSSLKVGPKECSHTYGIGYSLLLICDRPININIAKREGKTEFQRQGEKRVCTFTLK
jgi:hypothetical protein